MSKSRLVREVGRNYNQYLGEGTPGTGTVTSVDLSAPLGFSVSGNPITTAGTLALAFASGYSLPTTIKQSNWDDAYTFVSNFPSQTGNNGKFLYTSGSVLSWQPALENPMNAYGQMIFGGTSGVPSVISPNSTTTRKYLHQIGDGTNPFAPSWDTIPSSDIVGQALTRVNDTNVQITLTGTPSNSVLNAVGLTMGWTGQLAVGRGGTGASSLTGVVIGNGTSAMTAVSGTSSQYLRRNSANTAYEFGVIVASDIPGNELTVTNDTNITMSPSLLAATALLQSVNLTMGWSGQLAVSRGGTGASSLTGILVGNGTSAVTAITGGSSQILRRNPSNTAYEFWSANYLVNPMNLEGQIIYADTGGIAVALAPNGTSTRKYLSQINGLAPSWEAITGFISGSGSINYVPIWTSSTALGNSALSITGGEANFGLNKLVAGNTSAPNGSIMLQDNYSSGHLGNIGTMYSGGNLMLGYAVTPSTSSATGFFSSTTLTNWFRSAIVAGENVSIYTGAQQSVAVGSSVTMSERMRITNAGDLQMITGNIQLNTATNITWGGVYGTDIPTISGTSGSGSNGFLQFYPAGSTSGVKMALRRTGQLKLTSYTSSTAFTGTSVASLAVDSTGDVITIAAPQTTASGTYTPTWSAISNVDSVTAFTCQYMRVGDTVTVSGWVTINATSDNTPTSLSFSLPINSNTSSVNYLNGTGVAQGGGAAACLSGYGSNFGEFAVIPFVDTSVNYSFHFTYRIV